MCVRREARSKREKKSERSQSVWGKGTTTTTTTQKTNENITSKVRARPLNNNGKGGRKTELN